MPDGHNRSAWIHEQPGLTALALVSALLALFVLLPYLQFVLFGVVLAYILFPVQERLEQYIRPTVAAITIVVATLLIVLIPLIYVITIAVRQALDVVNSINQGELDVAAIEEAIQFNGYAVDLVELYQSNQDRIATGLEQLAMGVLDFAGSLPSLFIGLTITLFILFALLRDGKRLLAWVQWVLPVDDTILDELRTGLDQLMWASVVGNVAVAAIQAVLLGVGLFVAGVPAVIFLTVATFVLTLLPLVGAFGVWIPAAAYLAAVGRVTAAAAMVVYGLFVTFSDSYFRPALIGQTSAYNAAIVIVGIFGGLIVFGAVGLFIGPVALGGAKLVLDCFARERTGVPTPDAQREQTTPGAESAPAAAESETTLDTADATADTELEESEKTNVDTDTENRSGD
ncbi:AI-2E family transporter [Natrialba sp. PRR66]|uniref:AI-2E family transporter n=1 Tax=Natrialba sp. PRR66 TaxID=3098146 RepID=UPI002B1D4F51|nr:AI-2E family transporter [Natrialba sp. PRR66]